MIVRNVTLRNKAEVDNHIPQDDISDYNPLKNAIVIYYNNLSTFEADKTHISDVF